MDGWIDWKGRRGERGENVQKGVYVCVVNDCTYSVFGST